MPSPVRETAQENCAEIVPIELVRTPDYYRRMARNWERIGEVELRVLLMHAADDWEADQANKGEV